MVKRALAAMAGAVAGALLWYGVQTLFFARPHADPSAEACEVGPWIDCVNYQAPAPKSAPATEAAAAPIAASCKDWLSVGSAAALSECLHAARAHDRRPQAIGRSI